MAFGLHNIELAFLEGINQVLSPCFVPIFLIALAAGLEGERKRPFGIAFGFVFAFTALSLGSPYLFESAGIDSNLLNQSAYVLLLLLGMSLFFIKLSEDLDEIKQRMIATGKHFTIRHNAGFSGGAAIGVLIGAIWLPGVGPILVIVIRQISTQLLTIESFLILTVFSLGAVIPMLIMILVVRWVMARLLFLHRYLHLIRKFLGGVIIVAVLVASGWVSPKKTFLGRLPESKIEEIQLSKGLAKSYPAPEIKDIDIWLNSSDALSLKNLGGQVVLINFWSYSCADCMEVLPHLSKWYAKYHDKGLEIIGIHSPEFNFEKKLLNVAHALAKYNIEYPVALDNRLATWGAYKNRHRPARYLIDKQGNIVYMHFGTGNYEITEKNIRTLLELNKKIEKKPS